MFTKRLRILILSICCLHVLFSEAQISQGGIPLSIADEYRGQIHKNNLPTIIMPIVDNQHLQEEIRKNVDSEALQFAHCFDIPIDIKKEGLVDSLNIGFLYRCQIESKSAISLYVVFEKYHIPLGAKLFIYDEKYEEILGAFTSNNNKKNGKFAVSPVKSDKVIIEYFEPYYAEFDGEVKIGQIYHGFIDIEANNENLASTCEVDINCSEGNNWQTEKHSVCKIIFNGYLCSGSLINNTNFDGTPYFLTANHCISTENVASTCIFYFNYENNSCGTSSLHSIQSLSGAILRATSDNTDFTLLELIEQPPSTYSPLFAGWDRSITHNPGGVCIHHPHGDAKKISTYEIAPKNTSCFTSAPNNFYLIDEWIETEHGHGVTEGGSSGSPLFNNKHRIIGQLYGGCSWHNSNCNNPANDYSIYGKFYLSWDYGNNASERLKDWLDPDNKNYNAIEGLSTCVNHYILDINVHHSVDIEGVTSYYSQSYINSIAQIDSGAQVLYVANHHISLSYGFHAKKGSEFRALLNHTSCYISNPISVSNWDSYENNSLHYSVVSATGYALKIYSQSGENVYKEQDTIINDVVDIQLPNSLEQNKDYIMTIAFFNAKDTISNTTLLSHNNASKYQKSKYGNNYIQDTNKLDAILYPNPVIDKLSLKVISKRITPFSIKIFNTNGVLITSYAHVDAGEINFNVNSFPSGNYILQVIMGNNMISKIFTKK